MSSKSSDEGVSGISSASGLTDFVLRRTSGDVPIFGGDPRTGVGELWNATTSSISMLRDRAYNRARIKVINPFEEPAPLYDAAELDIDKINLLLANSQVPIADISKYMTLLLETQRIIKKREAVRMRSNARITSPVFDIPALYEYPDTFRLYREIGGEFHATGLGSLVSRVEQLMQYRFRSPTLALVAITHESFTPGADTNRVLAHMGDSLMHYFTAFHVYREGGNVSEVDRIIQKHQTNEAFREIGLTLKVHELVRAQAGVDVTTKRILATVVEALAGAVIYDSELSIEVMKHVCHLFEAVPQVIVVHAERTVKDLFWWRAQDELFLGGEVKGSVKIRESLPIIAQPPYRPPSDVVETELDKEGFPECSGVGVVIKEDIDESKYVKGSKIPSTIVFE